MALKSSSNPKVPLGSTSNLKTPEPSTSNANVLQAQHISLREALEALTAINQDIAVLDYGNVVIRRYYEKLATVRLLGGGIAGTDLCQAICVGRGMLTAAILGEDSVPGSRQILHTIKELNQGENCGIFVIVQASADLFNFGLAVQRANEDCRTRVKLLPIDDDKSERKERYSCGFILLAKVLGAMADSGMLFDDIYKYYKLIVDHIVTVPLRYIDDGDQKKGLCLTQDFETHFHQVIDKKSQFNLSLHPSIPTVALINTSRSLNRLTEMGLIRQTVEKLRQWGVCLVRLYYGSYITAAPRTASLTTMKVLDSKIIEYLDMKCDAYGWRHGTQFLPEIQITNELPGLLKHHGRVEIPPKGVLLSDTQSKTLLKAVRFACDALTSCERQLNTIDAESSGGNVGSRLKKFSTAISQKLAEKKLPITCPYVFLKKLGVIAEAAMGGTMGTIYGMLFESAAEIFGDLTDGEILTPFMWARALTHAVISIKMFTSDEKAETTMYYPITCCERAINKEIARDQDYLQCYGFGVTVAEEAAQKTKRPHCKHPDAGAHAVGIWMRALYEGVKLVSSNMCGGT